MENSINAADGTIFYMVSAFAIKFIGAFYRVPLFNLLSAKGVGLYQMIFPLFAFLITLCGAFLVPAMTKLIGEGQNAKKLLKNCLSIFLPSSLAITLLLIIFSTKIASLQGNADGGILYKIIALAILPTTIIFCLRGYFQGLCSFKPTAVSQLTEQIIKAAFGILFILIFGGDYLSRAISACFAVVVSEFAALFYLLTLYFISQKREKAQNLYDNQKIVTEDFQNKIDDNKNDYNINGDNIIKITESDGGKDILSCNNSTAYCEKVISKRELLRQIFPLCLMSLCYPLAALCDSFIIINALKGIYGDDGIGIYGLYSGAVLTVIMLPVGVLHALSCGCLPRLAREKQNNAYKKLLMIIFTLSAISALLIALFPSLIIKILFNNRLESFDLLRNLLIFSSPIVLLFSLLQTTNTILLAKGKQSFSLLSIFIGVVIKTIINLFLVKIPKINVFGAVISDMGCYLVALTANLLYIYYRTKKERSQGLEEEGYEDNDSRLGNGCGHGDGRRCEGDNFGKEGDLPHGTDKERAIFKG